MTKYSDLSELEMIAEGDVGFIRETILMFLEETPQNLQSIKNFMAEGDWSSLNKLIHRMKSSCLLFGIKDIMPLMDTLEKTDKEEVIKSMVSKLTRIYEAAMEELRQYILKPF